MDLDQSYRVQDQDRVLPTTPTSTGLFSFELACLEQNNNISFQTYPPSPSPFPSNESFSLYQIESLSPLPTSTSVSISISTSTSTLCSSPSNSFFSDSFSALSSSPYYSLSSHSPPTSNNDNNNSFLPYPTTPLQTNNNNSSRSTPIGNNDNNNSFLPYPTTPLQADDINNSCNINNNNKPAVRITTVGQSTVFTVMYQTINNLNTIQKLTEIFRAIPCKGKIR